MIRRVVITGMGDATTFGKNWQAVSARLSAHENAVRKMSGWQVHGGLHTLLGAPIDDLTLPEHYTRKRIRATGCVLLMSTRATELALEQAGLTGDRVLTDDETGIAHGSSTGSIDPVSEFVTTPTEGHTNNITGTTHVQMMPHTTAVNTGLFFGPRGRVIPISSAYTSGSQAIGYAWETIRHGYQMVMVAGGAEELCPPEAAVSDMSFVISQRNDEPKTTPSPFDERRDGLAIGGGAGTLVLEELKHAKACGVTIYGETAGFATSCDTAHIIQPQRGIVQTCMEKPLNMAGISVWDIGYVSAHGTAANRGDVAESQATSAVYGDNVSLSSLKSYFGHTLGTCGALEAWMSLQMVREGQFAFTPNLSQSGTNCGAPNCIMGETRKIDYEFSQNSNFALGGINTSIIIERWP